MERKTLDSQVSISAEPALDEFAALAEQGVEVVVCNRPENEAEDNASFADLEHAVTAAGMAFVAIPFSRGQMQPAHSEEFARLLSSGKKVHAFCRTGNRSCNLWAAAGCLNGADKEQLHQAAQKAGFDISGVLVTY
ncbi:TIGR01244 family sulfur transferase [Microbulbifer hydrolyticus]|uniref:Sulfide:quinone oxidoreductase n=1 Tax=Microbulbifer hydrolyticus TaxID=48074 RepID=A0A6P1TDT8_9GAMM|nr:TIGR01244 family sulfur transferase [Microbulbifer hydrolyticus]MBB5210658.1 sulfide:quinone oxidoreductase [Microbulbifer hydrolyticus]QHQ38882.1 TIGR01244 family phosphatase [Microbulbifer hydrolyticus]